MAYYDTVWYTNSVGWSAVTAWAATTAVAAGALRRQLAAPAVNSERVFVCIVAGTTGGAEPAWVLTRGAKTTADGTVTWMETTGDSAVNGDAANTVNWTAAKAIGVPTLGATIQRNNGASYWICTTAGTMGASEPAWPNDTAGTTQADGTTTWTCLGVIGNFTGGQAPHARVQNACTATWWVAGNTIYVGDNHAESQATILQIQPAGSVSTVGRILCHNHSGSYPPTSLTVGATISTTGAVNFTFTPASAGGFYLYGLTFISGIGQSGLQNLTIGSGSTSWIYYDNCSLQLASTGAAQILVGGNVAANTVVWNNTTVKFAAISHQITMQMAALVWQNTGPVLVSGSSIPTNFINSAAFLFSMVLEAIDLSQLTGNLLNGGATSLGNVIVKDCKLNASMTIAIPIQFALMPQLVRSDSGATAYKSARYQYEGTETTETTITRVGGASDPTGQAQSRKIVTTANSQWLRPFKAEPYAIWNPTTAANVTVTVFGTINAGVLPLTDEIWLEVEYLGSATFPIGTMVVTTKANVLAVGVAVASDNSVWLGGGSGAGWLPFKLVAVLSAPQPGMAGYIYARVRAAKPSTTWYIDPQIALN